jgi:hypothetical protein
LNDNCSATSRSSSGASAGASIPSLRTRALRLLRQLLPMVTPSRASLLLTRARDASSPVDIVNVLMQNVARGVIFMNLKGQQPQQEALMVLRHMLVLPSSSTNYSREWQQLLTSSLRQSLTELPKLSNALIKAQGDPDGPDAFLSSSLARTLAAVYVVAGHTLNNTSFMNPGLVGTMTTVSGYLGGYELYYSRLSSLFELLIKNQSESSPKDDLSHISTTITHANDDDDVAATEAAISDSSSTLAASASSSSSTSSTVASSGSIGVASSSVSPSTSATAASSTSMASSSSPAPSSTSTSTSVGIVAPKIVDLPIPLSLQQSINILMVHTNASNTAVKAALVKAQGRRGVALAYLKKPFDASKSNQVYQQEWNGITLLFPLYRCHAFIY